ncbi:hypothetical protein BDA99DRAFT_10622 [Phascolomyces articulosus]|uniref:Uncharacterized protein n=1 Tax=Phascolomyces articulosus TaxID=60185 RepID=A0AAD5PJC7_9FUNG|nr:hypothetical protein BDA99DRAFT_10622 [Phascolomyces articulosus]
MKFERRRRRKKGGREKEEKEKERINIIISHFVYIETIVVCFLSFNSRYPYKISFSFFFFLPPFPPISFSFLPHTFFFHSLALSLSLFLSIYLPPILSSLLLLPFLSYIYISLLLIPSGFQMTYIPIFFFITSLSLYHTHILSHIQQSNHFRSLNSNPIPRSYPFFFFLLLFSFI